jgi:aspartate kinase
MGNNKFWVFKFGGASVKSSEGIVNIANIVKSINNPLVVVVSAMGKTTNALEQILKLYLSNSPDLKSALNDLKSYHTSIISGLYNNATSSKTKAFDEQFSKLEHILAQPPQGDFNFCYDQIVSFGEIFSTHIISEYLNHIEIKNRWIDCRAILRTDENFREGNVDYEKSLMLSEKVFSVNNRSVDLFVTQGFIGGTETGFTTTLGREGSDYTAAILANLLDAESVTIWKDVEGVLNADPRIFAQTIKLDEVSFKEAIELAYCGAQIIHPKTIKPLQNKQISLYVKSFENPSAKGTLVYQTENRIEYPPILIVKSNQVLISLSPRDFSFVIEDCLSRIFAVLYKFRVKANLIQSSAINFSICVDDEPHFLPKAVEELSKAFAVRYNNGMELLTIRHYDDEVIENEVKTKAVFLTQKTRSTIRIVYKMNE